MTDTTTVIKFIDGNNPPLTQSQDAMIDAQGNVIPQFQPRVNSAPVSTANPMPTDNPATTYQGTIALTSATSVTLTGGNVLMASGTTLPAPGAFAKLTVVNVGANPVYVFWLGGTASATTGGELLAAGASDTVNLLGAVGEPSFYSPLGTTLSFRN